MSQTNIRRYIAGAALVFAVVLIEIMLIRLALSGLATDLIATMDAEIFSVLMLAHAVAGFFGGFLVSRRVKASYLRTGLTVSILAYIIELIYNWLVLRLVTDIYQLLALVVGATIGASIYGLLFNRTK